MKVQKESNQRAASWTDSRYSEIPGSRWRLDNRKTAFSFFLPLFFALPTPRIPLFNT